MATSLHNHLDSLHAGEISFNVFVSRTNGSWNNLSAFIYNRWSLPASVGQEDIKQEMLLAAYKAVSAWDSSRDVTLKNFVIWHAITAAKKFMNSQRAALRRDDRSPSRHAICTGLVYDSSHYNSLNLSSHMATPADPDNVIFVYQMLKKLNIESPFELLSLNTLELRKCIKQLQETFDIAA